CRLAASWRGDGVSVTGGRPSGSATPAHSQGSRRQRANDQEFKLQLLQNEEDENFGILFPSCSCHTIE
ncbi:unnamed protein product, partial [Urochloa humidicola]